MPARTTDNSSASKDDILAAAGSFTGLWALTWLGATAVGVGPVIQGAFAAGGVMATSGLTVLWWKTIFLEALGEASGDAPADAEEQVTRPLPEDAHAEDA